MKKVKVADVDINVEDIATIDEKVGVTEEVSVDEGNLVPDKADIPEETIPNVRIRMAKSHKCHIGGTNYDLEEGRYYHVPQNVKYILQRAGFLAPL